MVNASPGALTTIFVVSVTVMAFFSTTAAKNLETIHSPNARFTGALSLLFSYSLLFYLAAIIIASNAFDPYPAIFASMKVVFAAFVVPGFILLYRTEPIIRDAWNDPDFNIPWMLSGFVLVALTYTGILLMNPP